MEEGNVPGWGPDDALHCRTRAIWDKNMIFISLNKVPSKITSSRPAVLYASIKDYGGKGIPNDGAVLKWRVKGSIDWNSMNMTMSTNPYNWYVEFPILDNGTIIEYYVEVISNEGKSQSKPMTAPLGNYQFKCIAQQS